MDYGRLDSILLIIIQMKYEEFKTKVKQIQQSLGINTINFEKKFIFHLQQTLDAFFIQRFTPTPSQILHGLTEEQQNKVRNLACQMLIEAGVYLRLPVTTVISAQTIFHFFYQRVSLVDHDFRDILLGCIFLAGKSEETLRRSAHVALVYDQIFKIHQGERRPVRILDVNGSQYTYIRNKVLESERVILIELGFEVYRLLQTPHRYMNSLFILFNKHKRIQDIVKVAWGYLNDSYRTKICLYYPGQIIATACIHLSMKKQKIAIPSVAWWSLVQSNIDAIEDVCAEIVGLYELRSDYIHIHEILAKAGNKNNIENVFAVPYYRKITIDLRKKQKQLYQQELLKQEVPLICSLAYRNNPQTSDSLKPNTKFGDLEAKVEIKVPIEQVTVQNSKMVEQKPQKGEKRRNHSSESNQKHKKRQTKKKYKKQKDRQRSKQKEKRKKKDRSRSRSNKNKKKQHKKFKKQQKKHKKHKKQNQPSYSSNEDSRQASSDRQSEQQKYKKNNYETIIKIEQIKPESSPVIQIVKKQPEVNIINQRLEDIQKKLMKSVKPEIYKQNQPNLLKKQQNRQIVVLKNKLESQQSDEDIEALMELKRKILLKSKK